MAHMAPHHRSALTSPVIPLLLIVGCTSPKPEMLLEGEREAMWHDDVQAMRRRGRAIHSSLWFSAAELDQIARDYARRQRIDFKFSGVETVIWVPRSRDHLARVQYSSGIGQPVLLVTIGWDGIARDHLQAIAVDGLKIDTAPATAPSGP